MKKKNTIESCLESGIALASMAKNKAIWYPVNVHGLVKSSAFKVPHSEAARHQKVAGGKLIAWVMKKNDAYAVVKKGDKCIFANGLPSELLSVELRELFDKKGRLK